MASSRTAATTASSRDLAGSGNFPNLAASGAAGLLHNDHDELTFEAGLTWLLTGIAADCEAVAPQSGPRQTEVPRRQLRPVFAKGYVRSHDYVQARQEASP